MLILSRRFGESIRIGDDVEIKILNIKGNQVRIGIAAPNEVPVHRQEVYDRINGVEEKGNPIKNSVTDDEENDTCWNQLPSDTTEKSSGKERSKPSNGAVSIPKKRAIRCEQ